MATIGGRFLVCVDCMVVAVNGEEPPDRDPEQPATWALWEDKPYDISPDFGGDDDSQDGIVSFSWHACEGCGSQLGGERYRFAWFEIVKETPTPCT